MNADYILSNISFAGEEWKFVVPFALMVIDFLTGVIHAWASGHLKSFKMREGLQKKFAEICILVIGVLFETGLGLPKYVLSGFSIYIIFMEMISICENLKKMGVPIPSFINKAFNSVNKLQVDELTDDELKKLIALLKDDKKK
jgi:toxin secretion/phage lysis holin